MPLFEGIAYGGEKTAVILDIGNAYTKCGFAGENSPRAIIPSEVKKPNGEILRISGCEDEASLYKCFVDFIHVIYFRHLLVNPKERRIVVVESILSSSLQRNTLAKVLFNHYEVPSLLFAPSHLVSLFSLGISTGLVLDAGYNETLVLPVFEGVPILKAWEGLPLAAKAIHNYLEAQLLETSSVKIENQDKPLSSIREVVTESIVEDIKARCCFVTKYARALEIVESREEGKEDKMPAPPPDVEYPLEGNKIISIKGKLREHCCEVLFEQDAEERSIATLVLDAICKCPVDMRRNMGENILVMGGTAMLPGFKHRLLTELQHLLLKPKYAEKLPGMKILMHKPPARENYVAWLGGAIFGALEVLGSRSVLRETFTQTGVLPDWSDQAITNEEKAPLHTPRVAVPTK